MVKNPVVGCDNSGVVGVVDLGSVPDVVVVVGGGSGCGVVGDDVGGAAVDVAVVEVVDLADVVGTGVEIVEHHPLYTLLDYLFFSNFPPEVHSSFCKHHYPGLEETSFYHYCYHL